MPREDLPREDLPREDFDRTAMLTGDFDDHRC